MRSSLPRRADPPGPPRVGSRRLRRRVCSSGTRRFRPRPHCRRSPRWPRGRRSARGAAVRCRPASARGWAGTSRRPPPRDRTLRREPATPSPGWRRERPWRGRGWRGRRCAGAPRRADAARRAGCGGAGGRCSATPIEGLAQAAQRPLEQRSRERRQGRTQLLRLPERGEDEACRGPPAPTGRPPTRRPGERGIKARTEETGRGCLGVARTRLVPSRGRRSGVTSIGTAGRGRPPGAGWGGSAGCPPKRPRHPRARRRPRTGWRSVRWSTATTWGSCPAAPISRLGATQGRPSRKTREAPPAAPRRGPGGAPPRRGRPSRGRRMDCGREEEEEGQDEEAAGRALRLTTRAAARRAAALSAALRR